MTVSDLIGSIFGISADKTRREVVRVSKKNPRSERLALELPLIHGETEGELFEVYPVTAQKEKENVTGYLFLRLANIIHRKGE